MGAPHHATAVAALAVAVLLVAPALAQPTPGAILSGDGSRNVGGRPAALAAQPVQAAGAMPAAAAQQQPLQTYQHSVCYDMRETGRTFISAGYGVGQALGSNQFIADSTCLLSYLARISVNGAQANATCDCWARYQGASPCGLQGQQACPSGSCSPWLPTWRAPSNWALLSSYYVSGSDKGDGLMCEWNRIRSGPNNGIALATVSFTVVTLA